MMNELPSEMFEKVLEIWPSRGAARRRKRALDEFRRQSAICGYALDDLTDSQLEAAITRGEGGVERLGPLTGKTIYWALRRIAPDARQLRKLRIGRPAAKRQI